MVTKARCERRVDRGVEIGGGEGVEKLKKRG